MKAESLSWEKLESPPSEIARKPLRGASLTWGEGIGVVEIQLRSWPEPTLLEDLWGVPECSLFYKCGNGGSTK